MPCGIRAGQPRVCPTIGHGGAGVRRNHTDVTALRSQPLEDVNAPLVGSMGCDANDREREGGEAIMDSEGWASILGGYYRL